MQGAVEDADCLGAHLGRQAQLRGIERGAARRDQFGVANVELRDLDVEQAGEEMRLPGLAGRTGVRQHVDLHVADIEAGDAYRLPQQRQQRDPAIHAARDNAHPLMIDFDAVGVQAAVQRAARARDRERHGPETPTREHGQALEPRLGPAHIVNGAAGQQCQRQHQDPRRMEESAYHSCGEMLRCRRGPGSEENPGA